MNYGNYIFTKRKELNKSQKALAEQLNVSISTVSKWETDERLPDIYTLGKLVQIFNVDIESFLKCEDKKNNNYAEIFEFNLKNFSSFIKKLRKKNGLSLNEVAHELGTTYQTVSKWESGESYPSISILLDIAKLYETPIHEIYYAKEEQKIKKISKFKPNIMSIILSVVSIALIITAGVLIGVNLNKENFGNKISVKFDFVDNKYDTLMLIDKGTKVEKYSPLIEGHYVTYFVEDVEFNFDTFLYENTVINCILNENEYIVNFYGWEKTLIESQNVKYKKSAKAPNVTVNDLNYEFVGWNKEFGSVTENLDVYSIFKYKYADITFDPNGGECDTEYFIDYDASKFNELPIAKKKGHTFLCWYLNEEPFTSTMEVYEPIVLRAEYSPNKYLITLDCEEGMIAGDKELSVVYGTEVNLPTPLLEEYIFDCWLYEGEAVPQTFTYFFDHNITLHAKYKASYMNIEYVSDENGLKITKILESNKTIVLPSEINGKKVKSIEGYIFDEHKDVVETIYMPEYLRYFPDGLLDNCKKLKRLGLQKTDGYAKVSTLFNVIPDSLIEIEIYGFNIDTTRPDTESGEFNTGFFLADNEQGRTFHVIMNLQINPDRKGRCGHRDNMLFYDGPAHEFTTYSPFPLEFSGPYGIKKMNIMGKDELNNVGVRYLEAYSLEEVTFLEDAYCIHSYFTKSKITTITIPKGTQQVGKTFIGIKTLKEITIPNSLVKFYDFAFVDTGNIGRINYDGTVEEWLNIEFGSEKDNPFKQNPNAKLYINGEIVEDERIYQ